MTTTLGSQIRRSKLHFKREFTFLSIYLNLSPTYDYHPRDEKYGSEEKEKEEKDDRAGCPMTSADD